MLNYLLLTYPCFLLHMTNTSAKELNNDLAKINNWAFQWKMYFNPDPTVIGSRSCLHSKEKESKSSAIFLYLIFSVFISKTS